MMRALRRNGWYNESYRHYLAAKGISTGRNHYALKDKFVLFKQRFGIGKKDEAPVLESASPLDSFLRKEKERMEDGSKSVVVGASIGPRLKSKSEAIKEAERFEKVSEAFIRGKRPVEVAITRAEKGDVGDALTLLATKEVEGRKLTSDQIDALKSSLNLRAVSMASAGVPVPEGLKDQLDASVKQRIEMIEERRAREFESPWKTEAREDVRAAGAAALSLPFKGAAGAIGAEREGLSAISGGFGGEEKQFTGLEGQFARLEQSPFFTTNVFKGNEEDGALRAPDVKPISGLFGEDDKGPTENIVFKRMDKTKTFGDQVQDKVDSIDSHSDRMASVDLSPFKKGNEAFKKGNREKLIGSIAELQAEEAKLKDRWSLLGQATTQVKSSQNYEDAFKDTGSSNFFFGRDGARRLADQTEKLAKARAEIVDSNNKVFARRRMLEYRLQRLDASVPPETWAPRDVERFDKPLGTVGLGDIGNPLL